MTHKLLLADDSVTIQRVVELTFSGEDVQVVTVGDGEQAIARIPLERPDIVLADIGMPKRSGYDVAAFVKSRADLSHIPVLLLAGAFEPVDESRAQQVHSDGVLVKPFEPQQVISRVRTLIESSQSPTRSVPAAHASDSRAAASKGSESAAERPPTVEISEPAAILETRDRDAESRLDDYFERLDAAFAQLGDPGNDLHRVVPSPTHDQPDDVEVPTLESLLASPAAEAWPVHHEATPSASVESREYDLPEALTADASVPPPARVDAGEHSEGRNLVADMFAALFAVEQGESIPQPQAFATPPPQRAIVSDDLVDEVTRRVLERLAPDAVNELVTKVVSDVAERLVRDEIARIKSAASTRL